jgi:hypothetical protein
VLYGEEISEHSDVAPKKLALKLKRRSCLRLLAPLYPPPIAQIASYSMYSVDLRASHLVNRRPFSHFGIRKERDILLEKRPNRR